MLNLNSQSSGPRWLVPLAACVLLAPAAHADVTIKQTATMSGMGGFLNMETQTVTYIQGDKKCDETETKMTNGMMKFMGGGKPIKTTSVIDLDKGVVMEVDHQSKTVTEMPLDKIGEMASQYMGQSGDKNKGMMGGSQFDTSKVTMSPPKIDYQVTGKTDEIDGHHCEEGVLTIVIEGVDKESGEKFTMTTVVDAWLAQDIEGMDEYNAFNKKLVDKLGFEWDASGSQSMLSALGAYGFDRKTLGEETAKMKGFPLKQTITLSGEGGQFDAMNAAQGQEGAAAAQQALKNLFGGGKKDNDEAKDESEADGGLMTMDTHVTDVSTGAIKGDPFTVPAKYKVKRPYADK